MRKQYVVVQYSVQVVWRSGAGRDHALDKMAQGYN